jgi:integrase
VAGPVRVELASILGYIKRDIIYVRGKTTIGDLKTEAADRWILLLKPLIAILKSMRGIYQAWVFSSERVGNPLCLTAVKRMWMNLMVDAGMATKKEQPKERKDKAHKELADEWTCEITSHYFRHNYITKLYYAVFDPVLAMWMVGHADYETTVNVYTHLKSQRLRKKMVDMDWMYDLKKTVSKLYQPDEMVSR